MELSGPRKPRTCSSEIYFEMAIILPRRCFQRVRRHQPVEQRVVHDRWRVAWGHITPYGPRRPIDATESLVGIAARASLSVGSGRLY